MGEGLFQRDASTALVTRQLCNSGEAEVGEAVRSPLFTHQPHPILPNTQTLRAPRQMRTFSGDARLLLLLRCCSMLWRVEGITASQLQLRNQRQTESVRQLKRTFRPLPALDFDALLQKCSRHALGCIGGAINLQTHLDFCSFLKHVI